MKFNLNALKGLFGKLAKSGMADDVARGVANVADDVAPVALDNVDDFANAKLLNTAVPFPSGTADSPVTVDQFKDFYNKRRAENVAARNMFDGNPYDKSALAPGFEYVFGIPESDGSFLNIGSAGISPRGHEVVVPPNYTDANFFADVDGKTYHLNGNYSDLLDDGDLKTELLNNHVWEALYGDVRDIVPYADGTVPYADRVAGFAGWRPHKNTALGKFFNKTKRMPNGISNEGLMSLDDLWANPDDLLPF